MCTTGTNGFLGCRTSDTPVAKNGLPARSSNFGGRTSAPRASGSAPGGAGGNLSPCTAEKLHPAFSNSSPRSSLISPPPPPGRSQAVRRNVAADPSACWSPATIRSLSSRNRCSTSARNACMRCRLFLAGYRRAHLGGEVLLLFLQAFAVRVAGKATHPDVLADQRDRRVDLVLHRALSFRVPEERLLEQHLPLEVLLHLPGEDPVEHRLRLALVAQFGPLGAFFLFDLFRGDILATDPPRIAPSDLHCDVLVQRLELLVARGEIGLAVHLDEHADLSAQMDVCPHGALGSAAAGLLACRGQALLAQPGDGPLRVPVRLHQRLLAIHHPCAGLLAQVLHHRRSHFRHRVLLLRLRFAGLARLATAQRGLVFHDRTRSRLGIGAHHRAPLAASSTRAPAAAVPTATALGSGVAILSLFRLGLCRLAGMVRLVARLSLDGCGGDLSAEEPDRADGGVVAGDDG